MIYSDFNGKKTFGTWNGGQLAKLTDDATAKLKAARPSEDVPAWAFRFLQSFPSVKVTLSACQIWNSLLQILKLMKKTSL